MPRYARNDKYFIFQQAHDDFLSAPEVAGLLESFSSRYESGVFKEAGTGKSGEVNKSGLIRGDEILWLESSSSVPAERVYLDRIQSLLIISIELVLWGFKASK